MKGLHPSSVERSAPFLLTPPNPLQNLELMDPETDQQETISHHQTSKYLTDIKQEGEGDEEDVFVLELQRGSCGLGLALVDGQRLRPGDRILAVNGLSLVGVDYQTGRELIQTSGDRPRLLVAKSDRNTREA
ncbi:ras-associating and dilute domain-containing protein-like isoform X2 [Misgurnus anguillicaudatus]|uniref:ras-associating and dilute domain-containing protein-like isoform X2 n=1 Tax=Misgurnus anguillicaudatus TaxID=75329 RepID=UPI003CCF7C2E